MKTVTTLTKKEILYNIGYQIRRAVEEARRCHHNYLESIRLRDKNAEQYDYDKREAALEMARLLKNLTLPPEAHLHIYTGRQYLSRKRRWKREQEQEQEQEINYVYNFKTVTL